MEKLVYENEHKFDLLEGLPLIFHTDPVKRNFHANWHENLEILTCIEGSGTLLCDSESFDFTVGDVLVINSNQVHCASSEEGVVYHCLIVDNDFCIKSGLDMTKLHFKTKITDALLYAELMQLAELIIGSKTESKIYSKAKICSSLLSVLVSLCRDFNESDFANFSANERVKQAIDYINSNYSSDITLDELAGSVGVCKFHLSREFKKMTGQTVFEYVISFRCKMAKRMIKAGHSVSESAIGVGFDNLSYFSRQFKRFFGILPSQYIKKVKESSNKKI